MKFLKDILTGIDGESYDIGKVGWLLGFLTFLGLVFYKVAWKGDPFDTQAFGIAFGLMITALGAALNLKAKTEPPAAGGNNTQPADKPAAL